MKVYFSIRIGYRKRWSLRTPNFCRKMVNCRRRMSNSGRKIVSFRRRIVNCNSNLKMVKLSISTQNSRRQLLNPTGNRE